METPNLQFHISHTIFKELQEADIAAALEPIRGGKHVECLQT